MCLHDPCGQVRIYLTGGWRQPNSSEGDMLDWRITQGHSLSVAGPPAVHLPSHCPRTCHHADRTELSHSLIRSTRGPRRLRGTADLMLGVTSPSPGLVLGLQWMCLPESVPVGFG